VWCGRFVFARSREAATGSLSEAVGWREQAPLLDRSPIMIGFNSTETRDA
jgi:hypothetical protein